jgi:glucose/arabinose dehydrogenase
MFTLRATLATAAVLVSSGGAGIVSASTPVAAATPTATLESVVELSGAVDLAWRADDPALYVVQQSGQIVQVLDGAMTPVLDLADQIVSGGEQGLLGLAFSADGTHAYVNFTATDGSTVVAELAVSADGLAFDTANLRPLITIEQPYPNHNGGDVAIGPDGMLYIGTGDGGSGGDPERRALNMDELLGKMLRIDPTPSGDLAYTVPADNPFVGVEGARPEIWSLGLRNPWRFSFDADTGDLWIADVGQGEIEEIDAAPATDGLGAGKGLNFGWSAYEGDAEFNADQLELAADAFGPIHTYSHDGGRCSVSGGVRARGDGAGALAGWYVFADYCTAEVFGLQPSDDLTSAEVVTLASAGSSVTAVTSGADGTVYVLDGNGVNRLVAS